MNAPTGLVGGVSPALAQFIERRRRLASRIVGLRSALENPSASAVQHDHLVKAFYGEVAA